MNITPLLKLGLAFCLGAGITFSTTSAALIAYDNFESYTTGQPLNGEGGGTGWQDDWSSVSNALVTSASLTYSGGDISINGGGQAVVIDSSDNNYFFRQFDSAGDVGDEVFFSFLLHRDSTDSSDFLSFRVGDTSDRSNSGGMGIYSSTNFGTRILANGSTESTNTGSTGIADDTTYFLVGRFSRDGASGGASDFDLMEMWVNPTTLDYNSLGTPDASVDFNSLVSGDLEFFGLRSVAISGTNEYLMDELRIGTSYAAVVPEPTSAALLTGACGLLGLRRRRRS